MHPVKNTAYDLRTILTQLSLQDSPHLGIYVEGERAPIQDSHFTPEQLLAVPGWAELRFTYLHTTDEWIPIFRILDADKHKVLQLVDYEQTISSSGEYESHDEYWVVPKAFPREQYYAEKRRQLLALTASTDAAIEEINNSIPIMVVDDVHVGDSKWQVEFNNGTSVVIRDNFNTTPPTYDRVSGEFAANQIAAIEKWSALKVNP